MMQGLFILEQRAEGLDRLNGQWACETIINVITIDNWLRNYN